MRKIVPVLLGILTAAGLVCGIVCAVQFAMALRYGELGRVVVYFTLAVLSLELAIVSLTWLVRMRRPKEEQS